MLYIKANLYSSEIPYCDVFFYVASVDDIDNKLKSFFKFDIISYSYVIIGDYNFQQTLF